MRSLQTGVFFLVIDMGERLIDKKAGRRKCPNYIFALYNSASVRKYGVEILVWVWIKLLSGSHSVKNHCYLGSRSVKISHGVKA